MQAYKAGQTDLAIEDFKTAKDLDPGLTNARLYLATAYSAQYIPGAPSPENIRNGQQAAQEFQEILAERSRQSLRDRWVGLDSLQYGRWAAVRSQDDGGIEELPPEAHPLKPDDPEPYYWVGVIDWSLAFRGNREMREEYNKTAKKSISDTDPVPPALATQFQQKYGTVVDEGIASLQKAIQLREDYDDAMAYLNLLYRQKADMETPPAARDADIKLGRRPGGQGQGHQAEENGSAAADVLVATFLDTAFTAGGFSHPPAFLFFGL